MNFRECCSSVGYRKLLLKCLIFFNLKAVEGRARQYLVLKKIIINNKILVIIRGNFNVQCGRKKYTSGLFASAFLKLN